MGRYQGVLLAYMFGQRDFDGWRRLPRRAPALQRQTYWIRMRRRADGEGLLNGRLQFGGAIAIEQAQQMRCDVPQITAAFSGTQHQGLTGRRGPA